MNSVNSVYDARRALAAHRGDAAGPVSTGGPTLEMTRGAASSSPPRLQAAESIEGGTFAVVPVQGEPAVAFAAFMDGIQRSEVVDYERWTIPVVHGTVAAAIRERRDRRMSTWNESTRIDRAIYLPVAAAGPAIVNCFNAGGFRVVDTTPSDAPRAEGPPGAHPHELLGWASQAVQRRREEIEEQLSARWCTAAPGLLYLDGGIGGFPEAARSPHAVGVVKSHRTLYVAADGIGVVAGLREGERTTAFVVTSQRRIRVASWYLRLRPPLTGDPFAGIVRVEVCESGFTPTRANEVSAMVLAEREPVALPDARWRVMAYGIRDCEEYLRAVAGAR